MNHRSQLIYLIWLNSLWWTHCCSLLSSLTHSSERSWDPEGGWRPVNTKPTRGQCLPGQHACLSVGQHWPMGLTLRARAFGEQHGVGGKLEGVGMWGNVYLHGVPVRLILSSNLGGERGGVYMDSTWGCEQASFWWFFCRRDVFACIGLSDGDPSWERSFSRWPLGVCDYLVPVQRQFHPKAWAHRTRNIYNWSEPHNRCIHKHTKSVTSLDRYV